MEKTTKKTTKIVSKAVKPAAKTVSKKTTAKVEKSVAKSVLKTSAKTISKTVKKAEAKVTKPAVKSDSKNKEIKEATVNVKAAIVGIDGKSKGNMSLPSDIFGVKPNKALIAQAIRVYLANQRQGNASTKTRSQVIGSTRKIYRQKGTGRARHGAVKAPIFVGGGIAHGPRPHDFSLEMPKKMKKAALISALSEKAQDGMIKVVDGEFTGKTKQIASLIRTFDLPKKTKNKVLFVIDKNENAKRGAKNIDGLEVETASNLTTYGVVVNYNVVFVKNAVEDLIKRLAKN